MLRKGDMILCIENLSFIHCSKFLYVRALLQTCYRLGKSLECTFRKPLKMAIALEIICPDYIFRLFIIRSNQHNLKNNDFMIPIVITTSYDKHSVIIIIISIGNRTTSSTIRD